MNYGLPYKGSKNGIAKKILDVLPAAPVLYDVFCGGCAITHAAMLSGKYSRVVANDINGMIPHAFETAITGGFRNEDRWISRDDFQRLYKTDPYVAICFSFGNNLREYCYARELEPYKRALHYAIFWKDIAPWRELCPESVGRLKSLEPLENDERLQRLQSMKRFERLKNLETLQTDESLCRLQSLERLDRINSVDVPPVLTVTTGNYRALTFERGGIIYCDPPYKSTEERYGRDFDFAGFYAWCEHQANPVFISEYTMPEDLFVPVASFTVTRKMDTKNQASALKKSGGRGAS